MDTDSVSELTALLQPPLTGHACGCPPSSRPSSRLFFLMMLWLSWKVQGCLRSEAKLPSAFLFSFPVVVVELWPFPLSYAQPFLFFETCLSKLLRLGSNLWSSLKATTTAVSARME